MSPVVSLHVGGGCWVGCGGLLGLRSGLVSPKQFTVGVLNATLDLAALVLVGVVGLLGSGVVLAPVVS